MTFEPKTQAGKDALDKGADPKIVESMEADGMLADEEGTTVTQHVDTPEGNQPAIPEKKDGEPVGEDANKQTPNRPVESVTIPVWKQKEELKKAREEGAEEARTTLQKEFELKLAEAGGKAGGATEDDMEKIAEEFGLKPELVPAFIERIGGVVAKQIKPVEGSVLSPEDRLTLDASKERERIAREAEGFEQDFSSVATQTALASVSGGKEISIDVRNKLRELAYSEGYHRYRLEDIIRLEGALLFPTGSKAPESGRGGAGQGKAEAKTLDDLTPDQILNMPADEFKLLSERLGGDGSRFSRTTIPKKEKK